MSENNVYIVKELVDKVKKYNSNDAKSAFLNSAVKIKNYVPYVTKLNYLDTVHKQSTYDADGNFYIDSAKRYILFIHAMFLMYTNITIEAEDIFNEYDRLNEYKIIEHVFSRIPKSEMSECKTLLKMKYDDAVVNECETHAFIRELLMDMTPKLSAIADNVISSMSNAVAGLDNEKIAELVSKFK